jgi:hypothetical protein
MFLRTLVILAAGLASFILGSWLGDLIWPGSATLAAVLGALLFGGGVLYITRDIGR